MTQIAKVFAIGLILCAGVSSLSASVITDFALFTGSGGYSTDLNIGQNAAIYGLVGSNGNITTSAGAALMSGLQAGGSLNPGGIAGQNATVGQAGGLGNAIVNGDFNFNGTVYGNVYAGGNAALGSNSNLLKVGSAGGSLYALDNVTLSGGSSLVQGDLYAGGALSGNATVQGTTAAHTPPPPAVMKSFTPIAMPAATAFSVGGSDVSLGSGNKTLTLAPGSYRDLSVGNNPTLTLSSGNYYFNSINTGSGLNLRLDLSSGQPVNIYVTGNASFGTNLTVLAKSTPGGAFTDVANITDHSLGSLVYLETHSQFALASNGEWLGTVYAAADVAGSTTELSVGQNARVWGALYSVDQLDVSSGSQINYVQPSQFGQVPEPCTAGVLLAGAVVALGRNVRKRKAA